MKNIGLSDKELDLIQAVFRSVPEIKQVILFGSRAKGNFRLQSDVDLALVGLADRLRTEAVAEALEQLPMPYRFDVLAYDSLGYPPLLDHIHRVGVVLYQREQDAEPEDMGKTSPRLH